MSVLLTGHSFVSRLDAWWSRGHRGGFLDRYGSPMINRRLPVRMIGCSGGKIHHMYDLFTNEVSADRLNACRYIILDIGSNDLDSKSTFEQVGNDMIRLVKWVRDVAPKAVVIVVQSLRRDKTRNISVSNFEQKVNEFNKYLDTHLSSVDRTLFWWHSELNQISRFCSDGIHLDNEAYAAYASSIRRCVQYVLSRH